MRIPNVLFKTLSITLLLGLPACGGGSSPSLPPPLPLPPDTSALPAGETIAFGALPANGSFVIAGVSFAPANAPVSVNDQPAALSALEPGHIVAMLGRTDASGETTAEELRFEANLIGNVDSVDVSQSQVVVMGQTIIVSDDTVLTTPLQDFSVGEVVQVSGYTNADGVTVATRIDYSVSNLQLRLIGRVEDLDAATFRFTINALDVDYSQAQVIDTPSGDVSPDMEVLITGGRAPNGTFQTLTITHYDRDVSELAGAHFRMQGQITDAQSGEDFSVNGFAVVMGGQRDYRQGSADDIVIGASVRAEGNVLNDGTAQVHRVWFLHD